jgi:hypothetical protein
MSTPKKTELVVKPNEIPSLISDSLEKLESVANRRGKNDK